LKNLGSTIKIYRSSWGHLNYNFSIVVLYMFHQINLNYLYIFFVLQTIIDVITGVIFYISTP